MLFEFITITVYDYRNMSLSKDVLREILLSFWKVHILFHAAKGPVVGQWMLMELRGHGYEVSPGTLYPLLNRMEERGWLRCERVPNGGPRARKDYFLTSKGRKVLELVKRQVGELHEELCGEEWKRDPRQR